MAFGINRQQLRQWQERVAQGELAFLTHYWLDDRFPGCQTVTKAGCADVERLIEWGASYGLRPEWIDAHPTYPHFDLIGDRERYILSREGLQQQYERFYPKSLRPTEQFYYGLFHRSPYAIHLPNHRLITDPVELYVARTTEERVHWLNEWIQPKDEVRLMVTTYPTSERHPLMLHRYVSPELRYKMRTHSFMIQEEENWLAEQFYMTGTYEQFDIPKLIQRTVEADMGRPFKGYQYSPSIFIEHIPSLTVFHSYDDRGFEVIAPSPEIAQKWHKKA